MKLHGASPIIRSVMGAIVWAFVVWSSVGDLRGFQWANALLLLAALTIVPVVVALVREPGEGGLPGKILETFGWVHIPSAMLLMLSTAVTPGGKSLALAGPWIAVTFALALAGGLRIWQRGLNPVWQLCRDMGLVFLAVGGAWTLAYRLGFRPMNFSFDIVQLTAVHFHYAGLVLPVVAGLVLRESLSSKIASGCGYGVLIGVPLVALGITGTQLGWGHLIELISAVVLGGSAMGIALFQIKLARETRWPAGVRGLWLVSGFSLFFGMVLAVLYAGRVYFAPLPWLDIPWMRALHGTANGVGFALFSVIGWTIALQPRDAKTKR